MPPAKSCEFTTRPVHACFLGSQLTPSYSAPYLTTKSLLIYRLAQPMIIYLPLSFLFAIVSLPFKVHFDAHFTYAGGFFLWALTLYLGMASVGLATEFAITILGPQFTGFFLIPLIIANVS